MQGGQCWRRGAKHYLGAAPALSWPWPGRAVPGALSYLVSCGSLLAVGALQQPRLFGKFI